MKIAIHDKGTPGTMNPAALTLASPVQSTATFLRENQDALFPHPSSSTPWILALTVGEFHRLLPKKACWDLRCPAFRGRTESGSMLMSRLWQWSPPQAGHHRSPANRKSSPFFPRGSQPAVWEGWGLCPLEVCLLAASPPPIPPPCPKASCRREPYGPLWTHFPWVQYLPGVNVGPSAPESAAHLLPHCPPPHTSLREKFWGGQAHRIGEPFGVRVSEKCLGSTHTHAHTENSWSEVKCLKVRSFLVWICCVSFRALIPI